PADPSGARATPVSRQFQPPRERTHAGRAAGLVPRGPDDRRVTHSRHRSWRHRDSDDGPAAGGDAAVVHAATAGHGSRNLGFRTHHLDRSPDWNGTAVRTAAGRGTGAARRVSARLCLITWLLTV